MDEREKARLELSAEIFKAVGHPMRLAMLEKLQDQSWCVCDIAESLGLNKSIASKHLSQLYDVGLLEVERRGTQVIYSLAAPCLVDMARCGYDVAVAQRDKRQALREERP
jgi:ArsR family transcriptional regulator